MSPLNFSAASELVVRRWSNRLSTHGIKIEPGLSGRRMTHVRFADDHIIYATSLNELTLMLDFLAEELHQVGLELNANKSKIFTLDSNFVQNGSPWFVDAAGGLIEVAREGEFHVHLGNKYPGDLKNMERQFWQTGCAAHGRSTTSSVPP